MSNCLPDRVDRSVTPAELSAVPNVATTLQLPEPGCHPCSRSLDMEHPDSFQRAGSVPLRPTPAPEEQPGPLRYHSIPSRRPRRSRSLLALLVSEDLARETDVYEGVPVSCDSGEMRKISSLRAASRVLGGADQDASVDEEDGLDVIRRRSIDVSSLQPGSAAPVVNGPRSRLLMGRVGAGMPGPPSPRGVVPSLFERRCSATGKPSTAAAAPSSASGGSPKGSNALVRTLSSGLATGEALLGECAKGRQAAVRKLLRAGVSPASADSNGRSALAYAAASGHMAVVECLVRHAGAAAALLSDVEGQTPIDEAVRAGHVEVARFLEDEVRSAAL